MKKTTMKKVSKPNEIQQTYEDFLALKEMQIGDNSQKTSIKEKKIVGNLVEESQAGLNPVRYEPGSCSDCGWRHSPLGPCVQKSVNGYEPMRVPPQGVKANGYEPMCAPQGVKAFKSTKRSRNRGSNVAVTYNDGYPSDDTGYVTYNPAADLLNGRTETKYIEPAVRTEILEEAEILPELEASEAKLPSDIEMFDHVRNSLKIIRIPERTLIYCIVVDKKDEQNQVAALRCFGGIAFGGYARDISGDAYLVECVQSVHLGTIPFSYRIEMPHMDSWTVEIPAPEKVLEGIFAPEQRKTLADLREKFPKDRYEIRYLQMALAN